MATSLLVAEHTIGERLSASMLAWRHSGFSVHNGARVRAGDAEARKKLRQYMLRAPMQVIALIDDAAVIRRILEHVGLWAPRQLRQNQRAPPVPAKGIDGLKPPVQEWTYHPVPDIA